jgi:hypothetical protein
MTFKVKVFISSICNEKYNPIREKLSGMLKDTDIIDVYNFGSESASSLPAEQEYLSALDDSHVCIFLIDNKDKVTKGVSKEIDRAKKKNQYTYFVKNKKKNQQRLKKNFAMKMECDFVI